MMMTNLEPARVAEYLGLEDKNTGDRGFDRLHQKIRSSSRASK